MGWGRCQGGDRALLGRPSRAVAGSSTRICGGLGIRVRHTLPRASESNSPQEQHGLRHTWRSPHSLEEEPTVTCGVTRGSAEAVGVRDRPRRRALPSARRRGGGPRVLARPGSQGSMSSGGTQGWQCQRRWAQLRLARIEPYLTAPRASAGRFRGSTASLFLPQYQQFHMLTVH